MSENSREVVNPRLTSDGLRSGRPPDSAGIALLSVSSGQSTQQVQHIRSEIPLERPGSPLAVDLQNKCKKIRGDGLQDPVVVSDTMELEEDGRQSEFLVEAVNELQGQKQVPAVGQDGMHDSYASVVNAPLRRNAAGQDDFEGLECDPNKVVVLDEDCVATKEGSVNPGDEGVNKWVNNEEHGGHGKHEVTNGRNRFAALVDEHVEPEEEHRRDPTAIRSIEDRVGERSPGNSGGVGAFKNIRVSSGGDSGSKRSGVHQIIEKAVVVPMVEGQQVSVVEHVPTGGNNVHAAVSLLEKGHGRSSSEGLTVGKNRGDTMNVQLNAITSCSDHDPGGSTRAVISQNGHPEPVLFGSLEHGVTANNVVAVSECDARGACGGH
ncbi:hypothetical protein V6N12_045803 [Hibiscus sabdariffa]|uniref:Uncharacterized protein n=1 Tax=Hibiscus sabdariffa TaxID=183260 RepID=A0ABR2G433_9ROSI